MKVRVTRKMTPNVTPSFGREKRRFLATSTAGASATSSSAAVSCTSVVAVISSSSGERTGVTDTGIDDRIEQVDDQVDDAHDCHEQSSGALHHEQVLAEDGRHQQAAHAVEIEVL